MGRLFDGVAALCGLPPVISFEGQAAMALEFAADGEAEDAYPLPLGEGTPAVADWEPLVRAVLADRAAAVPVGRISARFHNALAELAVAVARRAAVPRVVLSGGCFQNALLSGRVRRRLLDAGFFVYTHRRVPPGDGGIALGQVLSPPPASSKDHPMCLGIPGKVLEIHQENDLPMGKVQFGGIVKEICLAYTPEAQVGDFVIVHVGFAISRIDEAEAEEIFTYLEEIGTGGREEMRSSSPDRASGTSQDEIRGRISQRRGGPAAGRGHRPGNHAALEHHGGLRRPDPLDHPLRRWTRCCRARSR